jgi:hypothetical protein
LPSCKVSTSSFKHLPNLKLADPTFNTPSGIDMLIGAELYETIMLDARIKENNNVTYRDSLFGWVVIGGSPSVSIQTLTTCLSSLSWIPAEDTLKKFWEIQDLPQSHHFTKEEQACEQHFQQTTRRNEDGSFIVKLPFKENAIPLGDSFQQANVALKHFSTASPKIRASILDTQPSSKNFWIWDTWKQSRNLKSQLHPASHSTFHTTVFSRNPARQPSFALFLTPQ